MSGLTQAAGKLLSLLNRIERLEEERKTLADDIADVYKELVGEGFDKDAAKVVLKIRKTAGGLDAWTGRSSTVDTYLSALGMLPPMIEGRAGAPAREIIEEFPPHDPETGEITDTQEQPETATEQRANVHPQHEVRPGNTSLGTKQQCNNAGVTVGGDERGTAVQFQSTEPTVDAVAETQAPRPTATATLSDDDVPAFLKKDRAEQKPTEKAHCLKLKDGHCKIAFDTPALCADCNAAKARVSA